MPYWEVLNQIIPNNNGAKHAYFLQIAISREIFQALDTMAIRVVEFSNGVCKIGKIFV